MLYWVILLVICIGFIGIFSFSVLPAAFRGARRAIVCCASLKSKILPFLLVALAVSADISVAVWVIFAFFSRMRRGFCVGFAGDTAIIIALPWILLAVVTALLTAAGLMWSRRGIGDIPAPSEAGLPAEENGRGRKAYGVLLFALIAVAIAAAVPVLSVMLHYLAAAKFAAGAKKVVLLLIAGEVVIAAVICVFARKKIKRYLGIIFRALSAFLLLAAITYSVLLVSLERTQLDTVLMWSGTAVAVIIPLAVGAGILCGVDLRLRKSKADADVTFN